VPDTKLDGTAKELLKDKNFAHLAVPRSDGTIQTAVIWVDAEDDGRIVVNSAEGRAWPRNLRRAGRATISVHNREDPYEYVSIVAGLDEDTHEDADAVIDALAKKYMDADSYPFRKDGEQRVTFRLVPEKVTVRGG
jgi:PPOX class probable F420-dependent enzyme